MPERVKIIDVSERRAFRTIYEAVNWYVGTDYRYWGRACWPSNDPTDGFRLWFTQLAHVEKGRYVPSVNCYLNILCTDGNYFVYDYLGPDKATTKGAADPYGTLIFTKEVGGDYIFRGVFKKDFSLTKPDHYVFRRIASKAKLIGCPARRIELLDSIDAGVFDVDYLKKQVVSYDAFEVSTRSISSSNRNNHAISQVATIKKKAPVEPVKISDEECIKMFPLNCHINHKSFGHGIVKKIEDGIITIIFDKGGNKDLGIDFCIKNKLIEKE